MLKRTDAELEGVLQDNQGRPITGPEVRVLLTLFVEGGAHYLQPDPECDCFTKERGCAGHDLARKEAVA